MKKLKEGLLFFCMALSMQAQETKTYDYFHPEYEDRDGEKSVNDRYNDNLIYFHDVTLERGLFIPTDNNHLSNGSVTALSGSYFLNDKFGFRSGISYISEMDGSQMYWKVPLLFAFRTTTIPFNDDTDMDFETARDYLVYLLLNVIPKRFEFNAGPSLGYMTPYSLYYSSGETLTLPSETTRLRYRFASSIDANMRMIYQIGQLGLYINMGISYLWTRNYIYFETKPYRKESRPAWLANLSLGVSFRF
ncbi:MAG: hypothetical protein LBP83_00495 [Dysgonamonadaceae bacterium]|jgi:hypothetical protein|nr:hypothetical protein [Dysgonamonadaceae bacterium]